MGANTALPGRQGGLWILFDDLNLLHHHGGAGLIVPIGGDGGDLVHHLNAGNHLAEGGVLAIQMGIPCSRSFSLSFMLREKYRTYFQG